MLQLLEICSETIEILKAGAKDPAFLASGLQKKVG